MLESPDSSSQLDDSNGKSGRSWTLPASIIFIVAILLGAVLVYLIPDDDKAPQQGAQTPSPTAGPTSSPSGDGRDKFGTPRVDATGRSVQVPANPSGQVLPQTGSPAFTASDPAWLTGSPKGLMWQSIYNGVVVPFSTSDGPTSLVDGVPTGFARTPQGAVMAAWQINVRLPFETDPSRRAKLIDRAMISDGSDAAEAEMRGARTLNGSSDNPLSLRGAQILGSVPIAVKVSEFSPDYALISFGLSLAPQQPNGIEGMRADFQVVWRDGTWKVPFPLLNSFTPTPTFVGWSRQW
ncbi:hypothetical protein [Tsukamurella spumae]|uniref:DUF8175 domain-containing protein n=1 Tax=Tsukamurella spumae TaxID=44753 RepID=A0A846X2F6_9ACTN|nr:hypothetical protein [Tsukamurella spumae]NKY19494.1 hypothetical protein [Tsukamurella spumae]